MKTYQVDKKGYYGEFGGAYVPEILHQCVEDLQNTYLQVLESDSFKEEFDQLLRDYVGRPSPLYLAKRLSEKYGCKIYLKREDLNHTGAHKINNTIGQILLARRMGKTRIIAETGAGQHGVATATVCALMNMECIVYMGKTDVERQHANVQKMEMLGATVVPVTSGNMTLKDATNEAIRDWCCHPSDTYYIIGSTVGPHPYPDMVARLQSVISEEIKKQLLEKEGRDHPDYLIACVGGGSNAAGTIYHFVDDERVKIVLAEAGGKGIGQKIDSFKEMVVRVKGAYPNATAFATTLREVVSANLHRWGAITNIDGEWQVVEPREIGVLDRIGGGDGFVGGFLYAMLKGMEPSKWIQFGWATGALATAHLTDYAQPADEEQVWSIWGGNARVKR